MAERFNAPVLKTGDPQGSVGSNPTPSAISSHARCIHTLTGGLARAPHKRKRRLQAFALRGAPCPAKAGAFAYACEACKPNPKNEDKR